MEESKSKLLKTAIGDDRLSSLPDSLLYHILSFLPTYTTVFTVSLLSRRYLNLWKDLQVFNFDYDHPNLDDPEPEVLKTFSDVVNYVLICRKSRDILKIFLSFPYNSLYTRSINTWICAAIGSHLKELNLSPFLTSNNNVFRPPLALFTNCTNLVSLSLYNAISLPLENSSVVHLPALETLKLHMSYFVDTDDVISFHVLLSGCPKLEALSLSFSSEIFHNIHLPLLSYLKTLEFTVDNSIGACLEILDAPGLKKLTLNQITFSTIGDLHNVLEANLDVFSPPAQSVYNNSLLQLLEALSEITHLFLSLSTTKWLLGAPELDFPTFVNLRNLRIILPCFNSSFLFTVLHKCHKLQTLVIQNQKEPKPKIRTPQPRSVPDCLVSHLTYIYFKGFQELKDEMAFAEYILQNGLVLEKMIIGDTSVKIRKMKHHVLKKLSDKRPWGSTKCEVKFESLDGMAEEFPIDCS